MKKITLLAVFVFLVNASFAQHQRLKVWLSPGDVVAMRDAGIAIDHVEFKKNIWLIGEFSPAEVQKIEALGLTTEVLVEDLQTYYVAQNTAQKSTAEYPCETSNSFDFDDPENFVLGSMGGYFTYEEFLGHIDYMSATWPDLITVKSPIGDFETHEDRPIYWLKISDNPNLGEEDESEVLYTALHHAREPASLSVLIYYMYYLLENYETDSAVAGLINNTEMYFVPMINPDGYNHNQNTNPDGGGMWRKNKRDNTGNLSQAGVDLNRNYGYEWGGLGASTNMSDETYRGPSAFSEPESQAIKYFCDNHEFKFALNFHTYSNLLLFPFGFDYDQLTEDHDYFLGFTEEMVKYNGYANIISTDLYPASGDSDDWMYAGDSKPKILAMTPEVGESFWPESSEILTLCRENLYMNLLLAQLADAYLLTETIGDTYLGSASTGTLDFTGQSLGLDPGSFVISFESVDESLVISDEAEHVFVASQQLEETVFSVDYEIVDVPEDGAILPVVLVIDNGKYMYRERFDFVYGQLNDVFSSDGNSMTIFENTNWNLSSSEYVSPGYSITDSPNSNYDNFENSMIVLEEPINLSELNSAFLSFWARWEIEAGWDYAQVIISDNNGGSWTPLCGNFSKQGNENQDTDQPVYDGFQTEWVKEVISLEDYLGSEVKIGFRLVSDSYIEEDGFYFDDLELLTYDQVIGVNDLEDIAFKVYPNPASTSFFIAHEFSEVVGYEILDALGRSIASGQLNQPVQEIETSDFQEGIYFLRVNGGQVQKIQITR